MSENIFRLFARYIAEELPKFLPAREHVEDPYEIKTVNLSKARDNDMMPWGGDYIRVQQIDGELDIRLDKSNADLIELDKLPILRSPFYRAYLTNTAQSGKTAILCIGKKRSFEAEQKMKTLEEANVLRGEDNTEVSDETGTVYVLKKTITVYHGTTKNPLQNAFVSYKCSVGDATQYSDIKGTLESDVYGEETYFEESMKNLGSDYHYKEVSDVPSKFESYAWIELKIYLMAKGVGATTKATAYNKVSKLFGKTKTDVSYI